MIGMNKSDNSIHVQLEKKFKNNFLQICKIFFIYFCLGLANNHNYCYNKERKRGALFLIIRRYFFQYFNNYFDY